MWELEPAWELGRVPALERAWVRVLEWGVESELVREQAQARAPSPLQTQAEAPDLGRAVRSGACLSPQSRLLPGPRGRPPYTRVALALCPRSPLRDPRPETSNPSSIGPLPSSQLWPTRVLSERPSLAMPPRLSELPSLTMPLQVLGQRPSLAMPLRVLGE